MNKTQQIQKLEERLEDKIHSWLWPHIKPNNLLMSAGLVGKTKTITVTTESLPKDVRVQVKQFLLKHPDNTFVMGDTYQVKGQMQYVHDNSIVMTAVVWKDFLNHLYKLL